MKGQQFFERPFEVSMLTMEWSRSGESIYIEHFPSEGNPGRPNLRTRFLGDITNQPSGQGLYINWTFCLISFVRIRKFSFIAIHKEENHVLAKTSTWIDP